MQAEAAVAPARQRWEQRTSVLLVVLGVAFIAAYSILILAPDASGPVVAVVAGVIILTWVAFIVDLLVRVLLSPRGARLRFLLRHPVDVLSAVIPLFRALRVVHLLGQIPYFQRRSGAAVRTMIIVFALSYASVFVYFVALATLAAERDAPGATITNFGDAVWWAVVTIATVGYGDMVPITVPGRVYAVLLMAGGIAIVGTASATVISLINERIGPYTRGGGRSDPPGGGRV